MSAVSVAYEVVLVRYKLVKGSYWNMEHFTIRTILDAVQRGQIRIPAFQRNFVWEPDRVAFLIDSVYKNYPFGSLLFWRTSEKLKTENNLGPFKLPEPDADFPIDYVLDGQQRLTSLFGVFQTELEGSNEDWSEIYFDYKQNTDAQETSFYALKKDDVDASRHFPLRALFDTVKYRQLTRSMDDDTAAIIDNLQAVFKEAQIPVQTFRTDQKEKVAIIFERINRQGVPLDTLQLLSAWTWSEDFQLHDQFEALIDDLGDYGFDDLSDDISLLLRCAAAVLMRSSKPESLVNINGSDVRARFSEIKNGIRGALDFLESDLKLSNIDNLPYKSILVPLTVFYSTPGTKELNVDAEQLSTLKQWVWRTCYTRRYSGGTLRYLDEDIEEMVSLKNKDNSLLLKKKQLVTPEFFLENKFTINSVNTKTFIATLAQIQPLSFISGGSVDLSKKLQAYNRKEFHHLMPKAFIRSSGIDDGQENFLANFCMINRSDNRALGGKAPSIYKGKMNAGNLDEILQSHLCPEELFEDDYLPFVKLRAELLARKANELCGYDV